MWVTLCDCDWEEALLAACKLLVLLDFHRSFNDTRTMQSVLIGSEYPVMDTLLFYVENGEKLELSMLTRSRRHSSLTLCSVSKSM